MKLKNLLIAFGLSLGAVLNPLKATDLNLAWNAPEGSNYLSGYTIQGTNSTSGFQIFVEGYTNTTLTVTNLSPGKTYFIRANSIGTNGLVSDWSGTLEVNIPKAPLNIRIDLETSNQPVGGTWNSFTNFNVIIDNALEQAYYRANLKFGL